MPCSHKKKSCQTCNSCPLCPGCSCSGPRRGRGRPPKNIIPAKRRSAVQATKEIAKHSRRESANHANPVLNTPVSTPSALLNLLGIPRHVLPSISKRESLLLDLSISDKKQLYSTLDRCLSAMCHLILPRSAIELYRSFKEAKTSEERLVGALVDGLNASKKGSVERKTLRALFCSSFQGSDIQRLLSNANVLIAEEDAETDLLDNNREEGRAPESNQGLPTPSQGATVDISVGVTEDCITPNVEVAPRESENECRVDGCLLAAQGHVGTALSHKCTECAGAVHILCCQRLLGIRVHDAGDPMLCSQCFTRQTMVLSETNLLHSIQVSTSGTPSGGVSANQQEQSLAVTEDEKGLADSSKKPSRSGMFARTFQRARKDWEHILSNGCVTPSVIARKRRSDESIRKALKFLFQSDNIQMLSWGTKRIKVGDKWLQFPAVLRRKTAEKIYREYVSLLASVSTNASGNGDAQEKPLARSVFLQIVASLTRGQQSRKEAVDYVLGTLVYDPLRLSREIVSLELENSEERRQFLAQLDSAEEFLKFTFLKHIGIDNDSFHDPGYALEENASPDGSHKQSKCGTCMSPFQVIKNIKDAVSSERQDVINALSEVEHKFILYMGHQHRCFNQEKRIAEIFSELKGDVLCSKTVVLLD